MVDIVVEGEIASCEYCGLLFIVLIYLVHHVVLVCLSKDWQLLAVSADFANKVITVSNDLSRKVP